MGNRTGKRKNVNVNFIYNNIFNLQIEEGTYDIVYDSGCFHHIAPHRRMSYINLVEKALKPGGYFAITCFVQGGELGGADITDWEVYRLQSLKGGLGFTDEKLRTIFKDFSEVEIRKMQEIKQSNEVFGVSALWTALFMKKLLNSKKFNKIIHKNVPKNIFQKCMWKFDDYYICGIA